MNNNIAENTVLAEKKNKPEVMFRTHRSGYISTSPYMAAGEDKAQQQSTKHNCPCCNQTLDYRLSDWRFLVFNKSKVRFLSEIAQCQCGFQVPFHVVLVPDNHQPDPGMLTFISNLDHESKKPTLEMINLECRYLLHLGLYQEAVNQVDTLMLDNPSYALLAFYKAYALEKLGQTKRALQLYEVCLDLDAECDEAWHNKALIFRELNRFDEANFNLVKYCRLCQALNKKQETELYQCLQAGDVRCAEEGQFGEIRVIQTSTTRLLVVNQEVEGSFWLSDGQPSNVPAGDYAAGLLLAAVHFQADQRPVSGLVLGLGAGAGVIALLCNFARLKLTVIEIDQQVITIACQYFPLLNHFIQSGRLTIICQDAVAFVDKYKRQMTQIYWPVLWSKPRKQKNVNNTPTERFDFAIIDLYIGDLRFPSQFMSSAFLSNLNKIANLLGVNVLAPPSVQAYHNKLTHFTAAGVNMKVCYPTGLRGDKELPYQNRVLYNQVIKHTLSFLPYSTEEPDYIHQAFRRDYMHMVSRCESLE